MNFTKRLINLMLTTVLFICCCAVSASAAGETVHGIGFVNTNNLRLRSDSTINSKVVDTAKAEGIKIVALSGVLTLALDSMKATVEAIRAAGLDCKVIIGGAPVSEEFCQKIGADCYTVDAASAADMAAEFCKE